MDPEAVAQYLQEHPEFFDRYADLLAQIYVPHPHGGRAVSLAERQIYTLREKNRTLEEKLDELFRHGSENDTLSAKLHRTTLALIGVPDLETAMQIVYTTLREDFNLTQAVIRLWCAPPEGAITAEFAETSKDLRDYTEALGEPYCGPESAFETSDWFASDAPMRSFAYIALRAEETFGVLALASEDPTRFHPEMGTRYLSQLGEVASLTLRRFVPAA